MYFFRRWWKCWAVVARRSPLPRTAYQLGALEWFECSRALVCSSSEVFTSVNYRVLGLFLLSTSLIFYRQFFYQYVRWWFKPQNKLETWRLHQLHPHFCSLYPAVSCFNPFDCWFQSIVVGLTPLFLFPFLMFFRLISLVCAPATHMFSYWIIEIVPGPSFLLLSSPFLRLKSLCLEPNLAGSIARSGLWPVNGRSAWGGHIDTLGWCLDRSKNENSATKNGDIYGYNSSSYSAYVYVKSIFIVATIYLVVRF